MAKSFCNFAAALLQHCCRIARHCSALLSMAAALLRHCQPVSRAASPPASYSASESAGQSSGQKASQSAVAASEWPRRGGQRATAGERPASGRYKGAASALAESSHAQSLSGLGRGHWKA